jgi:hypothetical protein
MARKRLCRSDDRLQLGLREIFQQSASDPFPHSEENGRCFSAWVNGFSARAPPKSSKSIMV